MTLQDKRSLAGTPADEILICHPAGSAAAAARAEALAAQLPRHGLISPVRSLATGPQDIARLACLAPGVLVLTGYQPAEIANFGLLKAPAIWDMAEITARQVHDWLADADSAEALRRALGTARAFVEVDRAVALEIEDAFLLGLSHHSLSEALACSRNRVAIILGAGLGNMIYGTGMVRWISETLDAPVDLIIHNRFNEGVALFAGAPWLNAVYNGFDFLAGRNYRVLISAVTGGAMRPPFQAEKTFSLHLDHSYNEEGRFVPEPQLNFLGLEKLFGYNPALTEAIPMPFIRDIVYTPPGDKVLGVANGQKSSAWAKREWGHMPELVARLQEDGWTARSFGLPDEYVEGAQDFTGLPMRQVVEEIAKCSYFASHDGGLCHIAEALGIPTLWLFGSTGSIKNGPVYAHSETVLSWRDCGPCLYKVDWQRCSQPLCMQDITLQQAFNALQEMYRQHQESEYRPAARPLSNTLLSYEIEALRRQPPQEQRTVYTQERLGAFGDETLLLRHAIQLLQAGDLLGTSDILGALIQRAPNSLPARLLFGAVLQIHPGQTALSGPLHKLPFVQLNASDMPALIAACAALDLSQGEGQMLILTGLRYWLQRNDAVGLDAFLSAIAQSITFSKNFIRPTQRYLERFSSSSQTALYRRIEFDHSPSMNRMRAVLERSPKDYLGTLAAGFTASLPALPETLGAEEMTPHMLGVDRHRHPPVNLTLGETDFTFAPHETVLILVPHIRVKHAHAGTTSALILQHVERLAMIGLKPVVLTTGFDDIPSRWEMRNSVTFIQAHHNWTTEQWDEVLDFYPARVCLGYGDIAKVLALPSRLQERLHRIDMAGLSDPRGIYFEYPEHQKWGLGQAPCDSTGGSPVIPGIALSEALFIPPSRARDTDVGAPHILVVLPDARDFVAMTDLASAMPEITFTVMADFIHRGIEKNLHLLPPGEISEALSRGKLALLQMSQRPATLCAEAIGWLEAGGQVIAAIDAEGAPTLAGQLGLIDTPTELTAWMDGIRTALKTAVTQRRLF